MKRRAAHLNHFYARGMSRFTITKADTLNDPVTRLNEFRDELIGWPHGAALLNIAMLYGWDEVGQFNDADYCERSKRPRMQCELGSVK